MNVDSKRQTRTSSRLWPLLGASILLGGLAEDSHAQDVWRSTQGFVKLVETEASGPAATNQHPHRFTAEEIAGLLTSIRVRKKNLLGEPTGAEFAIFSTRDGALLAPHLATAFETLRPGQEIAFSIIQDFSEGLSRVFVDDVVTTARVFYADDKLNLIFGKVHVDRGRAIDGRNRLRQGFRTKADLRNQNPRVGSRHWEAPLNVEALETPQVTLAVFEGEQRPDWLQLTPNAVALLQEPEAEKTAPDRPEAPTKADTVGVTEETEDQLKQLKDLLDKGLITEDVYRTKASEILDTALDIRPVQ